MPNFESDSEDEFDQDRRSRPSGSNGKGREPPVRSHYDDDSDEEEDEEADQAGLLEDDEDEQAPGVAIWEEDEMEGMEEEYTDVESGDEEEGDYDSEDGERPPRSKKAGNSKDQMVSSLRLRTGRTS